MSDLHRLSNEFNKHTPKGFDVAVNNTKLLRDERGQSRYVDNTNIGVFIDFADPTLPPPSTVNGVPTFEKELLPSIVTESM
jgi:hypothetical protein